jgi:hypothetical protein
LDIGADVVVGAGVLVGTVLEAEVAVEWTVVDVVAPPVEGTPTDPAPPESER